MKIIVDRNTAIKAICKHLNIRYTEEMTGGAMKARAEHDEIEFDFEAEELCSLGEAIEGVVVGQFYPKDNKASIPDIPHLFRQEHRQKYSIVFIDGALPDGGGVLVLPNNK